MVILDDKPVEGLGDLVLCSLKKCTVNPADKQIQFSLPSSTSVSELFALVADKIQLVPNSFELQLHGNNDKLVLNDTFPNVTLAEIGFKSGDGRQNALVAVAPPAGSADRSTSNWLEADTNSLTRPSFLNTAVPTLTSNTDPHTRFSVVAQQYSTSTASSWSWGDYFTAPSPTMTAGDSLADQASGDSQAPSSSQRCWGPGATAVSNMAVDSCSVPLPSVANHGGNSGFGIGNDWSSDFPAIGAEPSSSVKQDNYVGLVNQAMTCYLNSLLQTLFMTPEFRNALYGWEFDGTTESTKCIPYQLQKLFLQLQTSEKNALETKDLTKSFGWDHTHAWDQHDVQELCRVMFDALERIWRRKEQKDFINILYQGTLKDYVKCLECNTERAREDVFLDLPLAIKPFGSTSAYGSVEEALRGFIQPEKLDGNNQYQCEQCQQKCDAHKGLKISKFPYLLTIQLKRFDFDYTTFHRIKLNDKMTFPGILNLNPFVESSGVKSETAPAAASESSTVPLTLASGKSSSSQSSCSGQPAASSPLTTSVSSPTSADKKPDCDLNKTFTSNDVEYFPRSVGGESGLERLDDNPVPQCYNPGGQPLPTVSPPSPPLAVVNGDVDEGIESNDSATPSEADDGGVPTRATTDETYIGDTLDHQKVEKYLRDGPYVYELFSIMVHSGSANGGHYYAYIKNLDTSIWYCFNDHHVTRATMDEMRRTFGGATGWGSYASQANAYMLMYRQVDSARNAHFIQSNSFSPHLIQLLERLDDEENKRREAEEYTRSILSLNMYWFPPLRYSIYREDFSVDVRKTDSLATVTEKALSYVRATGRLPADFNYSRFRLVRFDSHSDQIKHSFVEGDMNREIVDIQGISWKFELLLECRPEHLQFEEYLAVSGGDPMTLHVLELDLTSKLTRKPIFLFMDSSDTVAVLREKIAKHIQCPVENVRIVFKHVSNDYRIMDVDDKTLAKENVMRSSKIYVECSGTEDPSFDFEQTEFFKLLDRLDNIIDFTIILPTVEEYRRHGFEYKEIDLKSVVARLKAAELEERRIETPTPTECSSGTTVTEQPFESEYSLSSQATSELPTANDPMTVDEEDILMDSTVVHSLLKVGELAKLDRPTPADSGYGSVTGASSTCSFSLVEERGSFGAGTSLSGFSSMSAPADPLEEASTSSSGMMSRPNSPVNMALPGASGIGAGPDQPFPASPTSNPGFRSHHLLTTGHPSSLSSNNSTNYLSSQIACQTPTNSNFDGPQESGVPMASPLNASSDTGNSTSFVQQSAAGSGSMSFPMTYYDMAGDNNMMDNLGGREDGQLSLSHSPVSLNSCSPNVSPIVSSGGEEPMINDDNDFATEFYCANASPLANFASCQAPPHRSNWSNSSGTQSPDPAATDNEEKIVMKKDHKRHFTVNRIHEENGVQHSLITRVDGRLTNQGLRTKLSAYLSISADYFKMQKFYSNSITNCYDWKNGTDMISELPCSSVKISLGRILSKDEINAKVYQFHLNETEFSTGPLFDSIVTNFSSIGGFRQRTQTKLKQFCGLNVPLDRVRIRAKDSSNGNPGKVYVDEDIFGSSIFLTDELNLYVQILQEPEAYTESCHLCVIVRRWRPATLLVDPLEELVLPFNASFADLKQKVSQMSKIAADRIEFLKPNSISFPYTESKLFLLDAGPSLWIRHATNKGRYPNVSTSDVGVSVDSEEWDKVSVRSEPLNLRNDGQMLYYRDSEETPKIVDEEKRKELKINDRKRIGNQSTSNSYSARRERALKIYTELSSSIADEEDSL